MRKCMRLEKQIKSLNCYDVDFNYWLLRSNDSLNLVMFIGLSIRKIVFERLVVGKLDKISSSH